MNASIPDEFVLMTLRDTNKRYNENMADEIKSLSRNKIAMLIDGDNAQASLLPQMLVEAGRHGQVTVRRIYGDWTTNSMNSWKDILNFHAFQPIQQFRYSVGKNATDSAMIIDAMDILHSNVVDGFCLVSSDSDYTRLATRIRETGIFVMGIGKKNTPKAFVNACDVFVYTENLITEKKSTQKQSPAKSGKKKDEREDSDPLPILTQAFEMAVGQDGWAPLAGMGNALYQLDPGFDPRTYGHKQLSKMIINLKEKFEMRTQSLDGTSILYVKVKE
jgi:Fe-S-cluster formation regulator IscX/YfhJ